MRLQLSLVVVVTDVEFSADTVKAPCCGEVGSLS